MAQEGTEPINCRCLITAAGVFADEINNQLSEEKITIIPRRGEYWMIDKSFAGAFRSTVFQPPTAMGKGVLVTPTVEGTLILGPTVEDITDKLDTRTTAVKLEEILRVAAKTWATIPGKAFITAFAGLRAHLAHGDFLLGEAPDVPGLINAAGIESPGLTAAPAIGVELAALAADRLEARRKDAFLPPWPQAPLFRTMDAQERRVAIARDPAYGRIICRCEQVSEAEVRAAIRRPAGATTLDGLKRRTRAGMGRCQAGFCTPRLLDLLRGELAADPLTLSKFGGSSFILGGQAGQEALADWDGEGGGEDV
jgi:glycerol-3-phosphate dehydrogenase